MFWLSFLGWDLFVVIVLVLIAVVVSLFVDGKFGGAAVGDVDEGIADGVDASGRYDV